ncbi:MAG TPA: hypothetical protein VMP68_31260 [Candidatus Eisenbacteria bacterium]|nr:hypothetical protein [Candidatus Eisenbacteria bacterium]
MAKYPVWSGLDELTVAKLMYMQEDWAVKASNTTRTSTTTLADDADLTLAVEANATYYIEFSVRFGASTTELIKTAWNTPTGASGSRTVLGPASNATNTSADQITMRAGGHAFATAIVYGTRNGTTVASGALEYGVILTGATAGNVTLQWAQSTSGTGGTVVFAQSYAMAKRLA